MTPIRRDGLVLLDDEAWTEAEWKARERRRERDREYNQRPEVKARRAAYFREYRARNPERMREYSRRHRARTWRQHLSDSEVERRIQWHVEQIEKLLASRRRAA